MSKAYRDLLLRLLASTEGEVSYCQIIQQIAPRPTLKDAQAIMDELTALHKIGALIKRFDNKGGCYEIYYRMDVLQKLVML